MTSQTSPSSSLVRTLAVLFVVALSGLTLTGCLNDDNLIGENCYDEILNNGEDLVDCGGPICDPCDPCENGEYDPLWVSNGWIAVEAAPLVTFTPTESWMRTQERSALTVVAKDARRVQSCAETAF